MIKAEISELENRNNETESWFLEKINKIVKPVARVIRKRKRRYKLSISWTWEIISPLTNDIRTLTRKYFEKLYARKINKQEKLDKFLERHKLPKLSQEEMNNLNSIVCTKEIVFVIKNLPINKTRDLGWHHW